MLTPATIQIANEVTAEALAKGAAHLSDLKLYIASKGDGSVEVSDLYTDEVLSGPLAHTIARRLDAGLDLKD